VCALQQLRELLCADGTAEHSRKKKKDNRVDSYLSFSEQLRQDVSVVQDSEKQQQQVEETKRTTAQQCTTLIPKTRDVRDSVRARVSERKKRKRRGARRETGVSRSYGVQQGM
jgi:hypothetical protein